LLENALQFPRRCTPPELLLQRLQTPRNQALPGSPLQNQRRFLPLILLLEVMAEAASIAKKRVAGPSPLLLSSACAPPGLLLLGLY
jgi:hypothetical protein